MLPMKKDSYKIIYGVKWRYYYKLNSKSVSLQDLYTEEELITGFLACLVYNNNKLFALFKDNEQFLYYYNSIPVNKRCFFEIIPGNKKQKPHFDIDISDIEDLEYIGNTLISELISSINKSLPDLNIKEDIALYSSHSSTKRSYHLIVDNYYHNNNVEAKAFYLDVEKRIAKSLTEFLDHMVYSTFQQFRMLGSQKEGSGRIKKQDLTFQNYEFTHKSFKDSLITNTDNCKYIQPTREITPKKKFDIENQIQLTDDIGRMVVNHINIENVHLDRVMGNMILLWNKGSYVCPICTPPDAVKPEDFYIHLHQNPFCIVLGKNVYFNCRRKRDKNDNTKVIEDGLGMFLCTLCEDNEEITLPTEKSGMHIGGIKIQSTTTTRYKIFEDNESDFSSVFGTNTNNERKPMNTVENNVPTFNKEYSSSETHDKLYKIKSESNSINVASNTQLNRPTNLLQELEEYRNETFTLEKKIELSLNINDMLNFDSKKVVREPILYEGEEKMTTKEDLLKDIKYTTEETSIKSSKKTNTRASKKSKLLQDL